MQKIYRTHLFILSEIKATHLLALFILIAYIGYSESYNQNPLALAYTLLIYLPIINYSVGPFRGSAHMHSHLIKSMDAFFSFLPFTEREKLIFIMSDKFYLFVPVSFAIAYFSTLKSFVFFNFIFISIGMMLLFIGQNLHMYCISKLNEVDRSNLSRFYFNSFIGSARAISLMMIPLGIIQIQKYSASIFFLTATAYLGIVMLMYFWKIRGYEKNKNRVGTKLMTQTFPVLVSSIFYIFLAYMIGVIIIVALK